MNVILGTAGPPTELPEPAGSWGTGFGEATACEPAGSSPGRCWTVSDGGSVLGRAVDGSLALAYAGALPRSLPGWGEGSPLDDPGATARFLLDRYRQHGTRFLDGVPGSYAVALLDGEQRSLLLARDHGGDRKLFLHEEDGRLAFSTKLAAFADLLGEDLAVDRTLEDFLLGYEFLPWHRTPYEGVKLLPPGTLLEWREGERQSREIAKPPAPEVEAPATDDEETVLEALYEALVEALADQAPEAKKVGVLLGGFDSALVASLLHRAGKTVETFSFHFEEPGYDQPLVETLAETLGIRHHWVPITPQVVEEGLRTFARTFNQPASQPHYLINTAQACRAMRAEGILHCFSGDGCDGLFLGYPTVYRRARLIEKLSRTPRPLVDLGLATSRLPGLEAMFGHPYRLGRNVLTILKRPMPARAHIASRIFDELSLSRLRLDPPPPQAAQVEDVLEELSRGLEGMSPVRLAYHGKGAVGLNKNKLEGAADAAGTVIQTPFAHPKVVRLAKALPESLSRPEGGHPTRATGKYVLSRMAETRELLPREIIYQAKRSPVHAPVDRWYQGPLRPRLLELYGGLPFRARPSYLRHLIRPKLAESLYRRYVSLGDLALHGAALLATYAAYTELAGSSDGTR